MKVKLFVVCFFLGLWPMHVTMQKENACDTVKSSTCLYSDDTLSPLFLINF
ncbi:MAG TPA: hypothetical protein VM888_03640 [Chitinophagaceae bacterium]|nr:hypothetical protein [Chitinophagaceae bacterium]